MKFFQQKDLLKTLPDFPDFVPLSLNHENIINDFVPNFPKYSDFTFISMWCWNVVNGFGLSKYNSNLIIKFTDYITDQPFISFLGFNKLNDTIKTITQYLKIYFPSYSQQIKLIPESVINSNILSNKIFIQEDPSNHDYIFLTSDLAELKGRKYASRRNNISRFSKYSTVSVKRISLKDKFVWRVINDINQKWIEKQVQLGKTAFNDLRAIERARSIDGKLLSFGIYIDDLLVSYGINEVSNDHYAISLFEHSYPEFSVSLTYLQRESARILLKDGYKYWNWQQDLGIEVLKQGKLLSKPSGYLKKYIVSYFQ